MLLDGLTRPVAMLSGLANPEQWLVDWFRDGSQTSAGETVNEATALTCAAVKAAVTVLAETVASVSLDVFKIGPDGTKTLAVNDPMQWLLHDAPNPETGSSTFRETLQGHLGTWGNAYAEIQRARNGSIVALWQRSPDPARTLPYRDKNDGKIYYKCLNENGALEGNIPAADMLHIPGFGFDGLVGYSPIALLRETIGSAMGSERYASELFANDARPNGIVSVEGKLSEPAYERARKQFNEDRSGHGKRHRLMLLEGGAKYAQAQMNPEDVQMIEVRRFDVEQIARAYRLSPHLLQDLTHGTFSNITELGRQFIVYTMTPWFTRWKTEINRKLLKPPYRCAFNFKSFLEGDHKQRAEFYFKLWQMGALTANDILALEGDDPIGPEGDLRFVPVNMQTLETAMNPPEPAPPPGFPPKVEPKTEKQSAYMDVARGVMVDALGRMLRKESNALRRAAKKPDEFTVWAGGFYDRHEATVAESLLPGVRAWKLAMGMEGSADTTAAFIAAVHVQRYRELFVGLAVDEMLLDRVTAMTAAFDPSEHLGQLLESLANTG